MYGIGGALGMFVAGVQGFRKLANWFGIGDQQEMGRLKHPNDADCSLDWYSVVRVQGWCWVQGERYGNSVGCDL